MSVVFVAEQADEVLGFATLLTQDPNNAELEDLFVAPGAWRMGVGTLLVNEAEKRVRALGATTLSLVANQRALGFYKACGFEEVGVAPTEFELATEMRKRLV